MKLTAQNLIDKGIAEEDLSLWFKMLEVFPVKEIIDFKKNAHLVNRPIFFYECKNVYVYYTQYDHEAQVDLKPRKCFFVEAYLKLNNCRIRARFTITNEAILDNPKQVLEIIQNEFHRAVLN